MVGSILGVEAVGFVTVIIRLVEVLSFVKATTFRVSIAAFGRLQNDNQKMLKGIAEGMEIQILGIGVLYIIFALVGDQLIRLFFGPRWLPALDIYPFIAVGYLTNAIFALHSSALAVLHRNGYVALFCAAYITLFASGAFVFMRSFGLVGYGYAELFALPAYGILHIYVRRILGEPDYSLVMPWYVPMALALMLRPWGRWLTLAVFLSAFLLPQNRRRVKYHLSVLRSLR
jgi:PST family polysaccharide transporter